MQRKAASAPLPDLMLIQEESLLSLRGSPSPSAQNELATLRAAAELADSPSLLSSTPASELPGKIPAWYWIDLRSYHPLTVAASLALPMFFPQGERDYRVPPSELRPWQQAFAGHSNAPASIRSVR